MSFDIFVFMFFMNKVYLGFHNDGEDMVTGVWSIDLSDHISSHLQEAESGSWKGQGCQSPKSTQGDVFLPARVCLLKLL